MFAINASKLALDVQPAVMLSLVLGAPLDFSLILGLARHVMLAAKLVLLPLLEIVLPASLPTPLTS